MFKQIIIVLLLTYHINADCVISDSSDTGKPSTPRKLTCEGTEFLLSVPTDCVNGGCGLIVDCHGWTMNGN